MRRDFMIDCETWGTRPGCAIRSIGLVEFDLDRGVLHEARCWNVQDSSCSEVGLLRDADTAAYWNRQPQAVQNVFLHNPQPLRKVLNDLRNVLLTKPLTSIWADGSYFDFPILSAAYDAVKLPVPWRAPQINDHRTVLTLFRFDARDVPPPPEPRTAATRAIHQAKCLIACVAAQRKPVADVIPLFGS